jgi:hypothetical protein
MLLKGVQRHSWKELRTGEGYKETIGMEGDELNIHQKHAAKERRGRETEMIYCPVCRRYRWVIIQGGSRQCLECGNLVDRQNAR